MTIDASAFNFEAMKEEVGVNPFAAMANNFKKDERFYVLSKNKDGFGQALIRFLPDSEKGMIQRMFKINTTVWRQGKKRFVNEFSPTTIGLPDPFQERWQELWNDGIKEDVKDSNGNIVKYGSKTFSRGIRYVSNIKIIKDPANPENEGKIFLYEMSGSMKDKIQNALDPSEEERALGATAKELFNPLKGNSFRLVAKKGANDQINYDSSEVVQDVTSIYSNVEEALKDIDENTYKLSDLLKPEEFLSYEELQRKLNWVTFEDNSQNSQTTKVSTTEIVNNIDVSSVANDSVNTDKPDIQEPQNSEIKIDQSVNNIINQNDMDLDDLMKELT